MVYQIKCKDCEKVYIGETRLTMEKRMGQLKKDVQSGRTYSAIDKNVLELARKMNWEKTICLDREKRTPTPRKLLEWCQIRANRPIGSLHELK